MHSGELGVRTVALAIAFGLVTHQAGADTQPDCSGFSSPEFFETATLEHVQNCIENGGVDLFAPDRGGLRPLFHVVRLGASFHIMDALVLAAEGQGRSTELLEARDRSGRSIMHYAAAYASDPAMLTALASWGASVSAGGYLCEDAWLPRCTLPIHLAAQREDGFRYVATLLALGEDPEAEASSGATPTDVVPRNAPDRTDMLALLSKGRWSERPESRPARGQPRIGPEACQTFLTPGFFEQATVADVALCMGDRIPPTAVSSNGNSALHLAALHASDPGIIDYMMHWMLARTPERITNALIQIGADNTPVLHAVAAQGNDPRMITRLVAWGAEPNHLVQARERSRWNPLSGQTRGTSALHLAAGRTDEAREGMVTALLAAGADPRVQDYDTENRGGRQALHYAVSRNPDLRVVMLLAEAEFYGAGLMQIGREFVSWVSRESVRSFRPVADDRGRTALHVALSSPDPTVEQPAARADLGVIEYLLDFGFSPDDADTDGFTPLAHAARYASSADMFIAVLEASEGDKACRPLSSGATILAYLRANAALNSEERDDSGASMSPQEAYLARCPQ